MGRKGVVNQEECIGGDTSGGIFEARIHQSIRRNFLASPMPAVAFALAGTVDTHLSTELLGCDPNGTAVRGSSCTPPDKVPLPFPVRSMPRCSPAEIHEARFLHCCSNGNPETRK